MAGPLLLCTEHGLVEDKFGFQFSGDTSFSILGSTGQCPICGRRADYVDGDYASQGHGSSQQVTARIRLTPFQVYHLKQLLTEHASVQLGDTDEPAEQHARRLEKGLRENVPSIGKVLDAIGGRRSMGIAAWTAVLVALITIFVTLGPEGISEPQIAEVVSETVSRTLEEQQRVEREETTQSKPQQSGSEQPPPATELPTPKTR